MPTDSFLESMVDDESSDSNPRAFIEHGKCFMSSASPFLGSSILGRLTSPLLNDSHKGLQIAGVPGVYTLFSIGCFFVDEGSLGIYCTP